MKKKKLTAKETYKSPEQFVYKPKKKTAKKEKEECEEKSKKKTSMKSYEKSAKDLVSDKKYGENTKKDIAMDKEMVGKTGSMMLKRAMKKFRK